MSFSDDSGDDLNTIDDPVALFSRRSASCVAAFKAGSPVDIPQQLVMIERS